jgi:hypothetical protein
MSLSDMTWKRVPVHHMVAAFHRSEQHRIAGARPPELARPDLEDPQQNHQRLRYLLLIRRLLIGEIPPDTDWYEVDNLTDADLPRLHVIARCGWDDPRDRNELHQVAARRPEPLLKPPTEWPPVILWGHQRGGPFTIIEGNHRLTAYAACGSRGGLVIPVLVGLSPTPCFWHVFDQCGKLANDLWI